MNITVIDAIMGQGKTTYIFNMMRSNPQDKYIYIGIDLAQGEERCRLECPALDFRNPIPRHAKKYWELYSLVHQNANIGSTHQLFRHMKTGLFDKLREREYTLVIDEALDVVDQYPISPHDLKMLRNQNAIYVEDDTYLVRWNHEKFPKYDGEFQELVALCDNGNLVQTRDGILMWQFPASFLSAFKQVFICTYMFEGQVMADYFKANKVPYRLTTIKDGELVDYALVDNKEQKELLASLIRLDMDEHRVAVGKRGVPGKSGDPFTANWFNNRVKKNASPKMRGELKRLKNSTAAFFKEYGEGAEYNMWTTFKTHRDKLKGERYGRHERCFVPMNAKATNDYCHKSSLAYLVDRRQTPIVVGYFEDMNVPIREDLFALTELIQWIWRSRIREQNPKPIALYLPSERMRTILLNWIRYSDAEIVGWKEKRLDMKPEEIEDKEVAGKEAHLKLAA